MHPPTHAHDTITQLLNSLKDTLAALPQHIATSTIPVQTQSATLSAPAPRPTDSTNADPEEITRLQATIAQLQDELGQFLSSPLSLSSLLLLVNTRNTENAHNQARTQALQTQSLFDNFISSQQKTSANIAEMSMELMTVPMADVERERLDKIRRELDEEREKFTRAAVKLGKERVALEVCG